jgi:hypothetical protein
VALLVTAFLLIASLDDLGDPLSVLALVFAFIALLAITIPVLRSIPYDRTPSPRTVLLAAAVAIGDGEDPRQIADRLRDVDVPKGRARFCLDIAVRCLERAGTYDRLEGRLRREAAGWMRKAFKEMNK